MIWGLRWNNWAQVGLGPVCINAVASDKIWTFKVDSQGWTEIQAVLVAARMYVSAESLLIALHNS